MTDNNFLILEEYFDYLVNLSDTAQLKKLNELQANGSISINQKKHLMKLLEADRVKEIPNSAESIHQIDEVNESGGSETQFGHYELIKKIGHGGMGEVYLAVRNDGEYEQQVALKLSHDFIDDSIRERFERERQILAQLTHPNITHLLDGGTTEQNKPYIVMEYVKGVPLDEYCKKNQPSLKKRIGLILEACDAVSYAHNNLILHRDLKPDNILVSQSGWVKLLDFGIAKLMDKDHDNRTATQIMTRNYASPEQIQGKTLSVQSDLFSLGVIAYEMFTGHHPFPHRNSLEREQNVVSGKLLKVNQRTTQESVLHENLDDIPDSQLEGDLENILHKALAADPNTRYLAVNDFAQDLRNFLENRPIKARKPSIIYLTNKWVQRHKAISIISIFSISSLVSATVFSFNKANEALKQQQIAESESTRANKVSNFMQSIFTNAKPHSSKEELTARALLDQGFESLESDLSDDPENKYKIMATMLDAYSALSEFKKITSVYENHYHDCVKVLSASNDSCQKILHFMARATFKLHGDEAALVYRYKAIEIARNSQPINHLQLGTALRDIFVPLVNLKRFDEALKTTEEGLEHLKKADISDTDLAFTYHDLAVYFSKTGRFKEAEEYIRKEEEIFYQMRPINYFNIGHLENLKGYFYIRQKDYEQAIYWRKRSVETFRTHFDRSSESAAYIEGALARTMYRGGRVKEAIEQAKEAISVYESLGKTNQIHHQATVMTLAKFLLESGEYSEGVSIYNSVSQAQIPYLKCEYEKITTFIELFVNLSQDGHEALTSYNQCAQEKGEVAEFTAIYIPLFQMKLAVLNDEFEKAHEFSQPLEKFWTENPGELPTLRKNYFKLKNELMSQPLKNQNM